MTIITTLVQSPQELSSIAEMGDRLSTIDMDRKVGAVVPRSIGGGAGSPSNTMWPGPRTTSMPSGIWIHPAGWPQYTNVTHRADREDKVRYHRTNRFTNGRPK